MCGIFCVYKKEGDLQAYRPRAIALSKQQRHRGPDWSGCVVAQDSILVHERLAIVGVGEYFLQLRKCTKNSVLCTGYALAYGPFG